MSLSIGTMSESPTKALAVSRPILRRDDRADAPAFDSAAFGRLLRRLPVGIVSVGHDLRVDYLNDAAHSFLGGATRQELLPDPWPVFSLRKFAGRLFSDAPPAPRIVETESGRLLELDGIPAEGGENALLLLQDVTARERHRRAEREFVANAAHELRTPIAAIVSAVEVLQGGAKEEPPERDRFLGHIERESARLTQLASALLLLARIQTGSGVARLRLVEIRPLLEELARELEPREGVVVRISCERGLSVLADRDLLRQALLNIAANAARHTAEGEIALVGRDHGALCEIAVRDTGPGIGEADQERVFDRFVRGVGAGEARFGLGLAIAREIVRALGGWVEMDSAPGRGTAIGLHLPTARVVRR